MYWETWPSLRNVVAQFPSLYGQSFKSRFALNDFGANVFGLVYTHVGSTSRKKGWEPLIYNIRLHLNVALCSHEYVLICTLLL